MQFNSLVFPSPLPSYTHSSLYGSLIYIPKDVGQWSITAPFVSFPLSLKLRRKEVLLSQHGSHKGACVPCLFLPCKLPSNKILLHFHGNAEDVALTLDLLKLIRKELKVNILAMEYRGYGVYEGDSAANVILQDAETVFLYLTSVLRFPAEDIIVFGRSIGSGPACYLASKYNLHSLILMSAFTSLRDVVKGFVGSFLQFIVAERFNNKAWLAKAKCPVFIVHGKKDEIVSPSHAEELCAALKSSHQLHMPDDMDHNSFGFLQDFVCPLMDFYERLGLSLDHRLKDAANTSGSDAECDPTAECSKFYISIKAFNRPS